MAVPVAGICPVLRIAKRQGAGLNTTAHPAAFGTQKGSVGPRSLPKLLGYWTGRGGVVGKGEGLTTRSCAVMPQARGFPGNGISPTGSTHRYLPSRLPNSQNVLVSGNETFPQIPMHGTTRDLTVAVLVRNRRTDAGTAPVNSYTYLWSLTTADGTSPGLSLKQDTNGGATGFKWVWDDGSDHYAVGGVTAACSTLPMLSRSTRMAANSR
jgi:hypothetical protein